jgi:hypothetical protein
VPVLLIEEFTQELVVLAVGQVLAEDRCRPLLGADEDRSALRK